MKKRGFVIFACVALLAVIVFIGMHFFPSSPEGYVDLVEVVEIGTYTEDELRDKMLGKYRVDINERWGEPNKTESDADTDVYEFEDILYKVIITYDKDGQVIDLERIEENTENEVVEFHGQSFSKSDLTEETLEWLEWYNSLSPEEQLAVSSIPVDLYTDVGAGAIDSDAEE